MGFGLSLPLSYGWFPKGQSHQRQVPKHFGAAGRINLIGSLNHIQQLNYRLLDKGCNKEAVLGYLHTPAQQAHVENTLTFVLLDNASFHKALLIKQHRTVWATQNLFLLYLPPYSPQFNLIESVWRRLKRFLLPRRAYPSTPELLAAVLSALSLLNAAQI